MNTAGAGMCSCWLSTRQPAPSLQPISGSSTHQSLFTHRSVLRAVSVSIGFRIPYTCDGHAGNYYPDLVVKIEDGRVYINGVQLADDFVAPHFRGHDDHQEIVVKEGYYYVLGDHRTNSADSREGWEVPKKYIVGRVQLRWWPVTGARLF